MFILLPDKLIEGMVRLDSMDDNYIYNSQNESLVGKNTHKVYTIGTKVKIKVINASKETRKIDFVIEKDLESEKEKKIKEEY